MSLSPVVVIILVVVAGLILLYLVGRLVKPLGHAIAFACTVIARFLVKSQEYLIKAAAYSNRVCKASLKSINETGEWTMHDLTQRLNDFSVGLFILVGESILAMEVLPSLFPAAAQVSLPPVFEYSSAALFILCSAMFGDILFTCWGKTRGVGLFHNMGKPSRWIVGSLALLLLVFSDLVNGYFYIFRAAILAHKNTQDMTMYILGGLGLEVSAVAPFALHAVKQNSSSVVAVLWWFAEKTFEILAAFASFVPHVLDVIAIHLGGTSVYQKFDTPDSVKVPGLQFVPGGHNETATGLPPSQIVSPPPSPVVVGVGGSSIVPCETHELEVLAMSERLVCLTLNGVLGSRLLPYVRASLAPVKPLIRSSGRVDTFSPIVAPVGLGVDVSPSALQRAHASSVKEQFDSMGNNIVEAHSPVRDIPALHVHVLDCHTGLDAFQMLRDTKRRLPGITQVVVTAVTSADLANHSVQILLNELARLPREGVIATTLLVSLSSPLVRSLGEEKFFSYVGRLLADLCACHTHSLNNLSAVALFDQLGKASPFLSLAVATAETVSGNTPLRGFWLRLFTKKAVIGSLEDMLAQALTVTTLVMEKSETQAWTQSVSPSLPCALVFDTPLSLADKWFQHFEERNNQQVKDCLPNASTLTISGSPVVPLRGSSSPFRVGVACLYPVTLPAVETSQPAESEKTDTRRGKPVSSVHPSDAVVTAAHALKPDVGAVNGHKSVRGRPRANTKSRTSTKKGK